MEILGGKHQRKKLFVPKSDVVRPTIARLKRSLFDILKTEVEGKRVLDLFAGVGGLGLEALRRGAAHVTFVEKNVHVLKALKKNISLLKEERRSKVIALDIFEALSLLSKKEILFDLIFADPPYGEGYGRRLLIYLDNHLLLEEGGSLFMEERLNKTESLPLPLSSLTLSSERTIGHASLYHFTKTTQKTPA